MNINELKGESKFSAGTPYNAVVLGLFCAFSIDFVCGKRRLKNLSNQYKTRL